MLKPRTRKALGVLLLCVLAGVAAYLLNRTPTLRSTPLPATQHVYIESTTAFTISPDDQWLLFYVRPPSLSSEAALRKPHVLHTKTGRVYQFDLPEEIPAPMLVFYVARWSEDSRYYLYNGAAIVFDDDEAPTLMTDLQPVRDGQPIASWRIPDTDVVLSMDGHCSDCSETKNEFERMQAIIPEHANRNLTRRSDQVVSPDGQAAFYLKGQGSRRLLIRVRNQNGQDRNLATHYGACVRASALRCSPDGRYLAYQLHTGCSSFARPTAAYIVDTVNRRRWRISPNVMGMMHWTSDSSRLYFAKQERRLLHLHYVDLP